MAAVVVDIWLDFARPCNSCAKLHRTGDPHQPKNFPPAHLEHPNCGWYPAQLFLVCPRTPDLLCMQTTDRQIPQSNIICLGLPTALLALE